MLGLIIALLDMFPGGSYDRTPRDMERVMGVLQLGFAAVVVAIMAIVGWAYFA
jgi:hypothetical protein